MKAQKSNRATPLSVIGRRQKRLDGFEKVSGRSVFTDDVRLPGMLHGKVLRSPHARARIISIDTSAAESLPGVKVVLTGRDAPHLMFSEHQPVLAQGIVNYVGEEVAAVAAADLVTAEDALRLIKVDYEVLEPALDIRQALKPGAPEIHERAPGNIGPTHEQDFGDPDKAFAEITRQDYDDYINNFRDFEKRLLDATDRKSVV